MKLLVFLSLFLIPPIYANEDLIGEWISTEVNFPPLSWYDRISLKHELKETQINFKEDQILIQKSLMENLLETCLVEIVSPYLIYNHGKRKFMRIHYKPKEKLSITAHCSTALGTDTYANKELETELKEETYIGYNDVEIELGANSLRVFYIRGKPYYFVSFTKEEVL
ncbi:MAG: hypothetical protein OXC37_00355 [Bdellovibrionaceae bacterium]|nr:hypothetical protein [Pseudobdellovibrionaceae bacterium]